MIELSVTYTILALVLIGVIVHDRYEAQKEREQLEDRLMALSKPESVATYKAIRDENLAEVSYVDDETRDSDFGRPTVTVDYED
jgi:hypothetical protein